jgi:SAM-dependent methyltransferase
LHNKYSENKYGLHKWLFDQLHFSDGNKFVEFGCGLGTLWTENRQRIPTTSTIILSDLSMGMTSSCQKALRGLEYFRWLVMDAQTIPLADKTIDTVIANHMLYHLQDIPAAVSEIRRILKPGGKLFASTIGTSNLSELTDMVIRFDPDLVWWKVSNTFPLETGSELLANWFTHVDLRRYTDSLIITDPEDLIAYILSGRGKILEGEISRFREFMEKEFEKHGGILRITKDAGVLIAS